MVWTATDATLRRVLGVPGSAQFGTSVVAAGTYASGGYSARSQSALLVDKNSTLYFLAPAATQPVALAQGIPANATIVFSPRGTYAALFAPGGNAATLISELPQQPVPAQLNAATTIRAAAVSDAGTLLVATDSNGGVSIAAITANGTRSNVATLKAFGGMAFLPGSEDILFADASANTLMRLHNGSMQTLATAKDGLNQPLAVAASLDGRWAVTANHADGALVRVDLTAATPSTQSSCSCSPTGLLPLNGNAVFELTPPGKTASWIIEVDTATPRVLFIPPLRQGR